MGYTKKNFANYFNRLQRKTEKELRAFVRTICTDGYDNYHGSRACKRKVKEFGQRVARIVSAELQDMQTISTPAQMRASHRETLTELNAQWRAKAKKAGLTLKAWLAREKEKHDADQAAFMARREKRDAAAQRRVARLAAEQAQAQPQLVQ